jgi:2'-5' RNA ligase
VTATVCARLAQREPFKLIFQSATIDGEGIVLRPVPVAPVHMLLADIRRGIVDALGPAAVRVAPEQQHGFVPHVSLAYSAIDAPSGPYVAAIDAVATTSVSVQVDRAQLIRQDRLLAPHWQYRWHVITSAALGVEPPRQSAIAKV